MKRPGLSLLLTLSAVALLAGTTYLSYTIPRDATLPLFAVYLLSFLAYLMCYRLAQTAQQVKLLIGVAVVARLALLPVLPHLSDDLYRFVWDGRLLYQGYDPFAYLPSEIIAGKGNVEAVGIDSALFQRLNSPDYYTIYPPVNQVVFAWAAWVSPTSVRGSAIAIRLVIMAAEGLTLWLLMQLLPGGGRFGAADPTTAVRQPHWLRTWMSRIKRLSATAPYHPPGRNVLLYALNPLVIIELTGNLHFEALMLSFVLGSVYLLRRQRVVFSGVAMALAVCTKLLPLILLPLYWRRLTARKLLLFYGVVGVTSVVLFLPLMTAELVSGMRDSLGLYFQKFEFNASIYYLIREIGYYQKGYNIIAQAGRWLAIGTLVGILVYSLVERTRNLPAAYGGAWLIFLLLSTTVHPWYVIPLLAYSLFTPYRYAVLWSGVIFFSYAGYTATGFSENTVITFIEYGAVLVTAGLEVLRRTAPPKQQPAKSDRK